MQKIFSPCGENNNTQHPTPTPTPTPTTNQRYKREGKEGALDVRDHDSLWWWMVDL